MISNRRAQQKQIFKFDEEYAETRLAIYDTNSSSIFDMHEKKVSRRVLP